MLQRALTHSLIAIFFLLVIAAINFPYLGLPILYSDDGETLYHVFALFHGKLPFRDIYTHHFTGYILPIYLLAKVIGYSVDLFRYAFIINQALIGFGAYLCVRQFSSQCLAIVAGLLAITAREPFVYSFFPLYQVSLCFVFILWLTLRALKENKSISFIAAGVLSSIAFCIDQRGLLLFALPLFAAFKIKESRPQNIILCVISFICIPMFAILLFYYLGIIEPFIQQTFIFPTRYRIADLSFLEQILLAIEIHRYLLTESPILAVFGLIGFFMLFKRPPTNSRAMRELFSVTVIVLFSITFLGARDRSYYTIPWLPFLAILAPLSLNFFRRFFLLKRFGHPFLLLPVAVTAAAMIPFLDFVPQLKERNEANQVADFLRSTMISSDSLFVFGYRPDIYAVIPALSPSPFINILYIHPDATIRTRESRLKYIDPVMQEKFMADFRKSPPSYLIFVDLKLGDADWSPSSDFVRQEMAEHYQLLHEITGPIVEEHPTSIGIFKLLS